MNLVKNNPVTVDDIKLAESIYGPDIGVLKGKTTRSKPAPVVRDLVDVPKLLVKRNKKVKICFDVLTVCGLHFMASISKNLMYCTCKYIPDLKATTYQSHIDKVLRLYNAAGFQVKQIHCDNAF